MSLAPASEDRPIDVRLLWISVVLAGVAGIVLVLGFWFDWDVWPGFAIAVLCATAVSASLTVVFNSALRRAAREDAEQLQGSILARLPKEENPYHEAQELFVRRRFTKQLARYAWEGRRDGFAFTFLSLGSIGAALASSGLAAAVNQHNKGTVRWLIFAFGLVVALLTTTNQLWKPGQRSNRGFRAANALRQHGWDFALARGLYSVANFGQTAPNAPSVEPSVQRTKRRFTRPAAKQPTEVEESPQPPSATADLATVNLFLDEITKILRDAEVIDETAPELATESEA